MTARSRDIVASRPPGAGSGATCAAAAASPGHGAAWLLTLFVVPTAYTLLAGRAHIDAHGMKELPAAAHHPAAQGGAAD